MAAGVSLGAFGAAVCALSGANTIEVSDVGVRVSDLVSSECLSGNLGQTVGDLVVAQVDRASMSANVTRAALAALIRRRVPSLSSLGLSGPPDQRVRLIFTRNGGSTRSQPSCYSAVTAIPTGAAIRARNIGIAPCTDNHPGGLVRYDRRSRLARAARGISAGDDLGPMIAPPSTVADAGEIAPLLVTVGPVRIERQVEIVQPSAAAAVFVRDEDGNVFSAPLSAEPAP